MARLKKRGESGAAKNFVTRNQALKKLQVSLSDFRRLCILKGIHPQQPRHVKRANKGSTAPASFFYAKDIQYLAHEPILRSLREHKVRVCSAPLRLNLTLTLPLARHDRRLPRS